jgi:uncharacterized protein DUF3558
VRAVILLLALATLTAACSSSTDGSAQPVTHPPAARPTTVSPSGGNDGAPNLYGAPKVTTPLDTTKWQANPCGALTPSQLTMLGVTNPGKLTPDPTGSTCDWSPQLDAHYGLGFNAQFDPGEAKGLANDYQSAPGTLSRLPDIDGQPAVTQPAQNTDGSCIIYVGATDEVDYVSTVLISAGLPHYDDPCSVARQVAEDATLTMRSG